MPEPKTSMVQKHFPKGEVLRCAYCMSMSVGGRCLDPRCQSHNPKPPPQGPYR